MKNVTASILNHQNRKLRFVTANTTIKISHKKIVWHFSWLTLSHNALNQIMMPSQNANHNIIIFIQNYFKWNVIFIFIQILYLKSPISICSFYYNGSFAVLTSDKKLRKYSEAFLKRSGIMNGPSSGFSFNSDHQPYNILFFIFYFLFSYF